MGIGGQCHSAICSITLDTSEYECNPSTHYMSYAIELVMFLLYFRTKTMYVILCETQSRNLFE